jgi:hypothetical protein
VAKVRVWWVGYNFRYVDGQIGLVVGLVQSLLADFCDVFLFSTGKGKDEVTSENKYLFGVYRQSRTNGPSHPKQECNDWTCSKKTFFVHVVCGEEIRGPVDRSSENPCRCSSSR